MDRPETRRGRQYHHIDVGREDLLVVIKAPEFLDLGQVELLLRGVDLVLEQIAERDDLDAGGRIEAVLRGAGAAAAAADHTYADAVGTAVGAERARGGHARQGGGAGAGGREFHEVATRQIRLRGRFHGEAGGWVKLLAESSGDAR